MIITKEVLSGRFTVWSTDPTLPHCYGMGDTKENAVMSYKLLKRVLIK
jgi:hypothetical protein